MDTSLEEKKAKCLEAIVPGHKTKALFTLFLINGMAMTSVIRAKITDINLDASKPFVKYKQGREHKERGIYLEEDMLLFAGDVQRIKSDYEALGTMWGNACLNVVTETPEAARAIIEQDNLNPFFTDEAKAKVVHIARKSESESGTVETVVFPEIETSHAVIQGYKRKEAAQA